MPPSQRRTYTFVLHVLLTQIESRNRGWLKKIMWSLYNARKSVSYITRITETVVRDVTEFSFRIFRRIDVMKQHTIPNISQNSLPTLISGYFAIPLGSRLQKIRMTNTVFHHPEPGSHWVQFVSNYSYPFLWALSCCWKRRCGLFSRFIRVHLHPLRLRLI